MKTVLPILTLLCCCSIAKAQNFDHRIQNNRHISCQDIEFNASDIIRDYFNKNEIDSLQEFLVYWKERCGMSEEVFRFQTLLQLMSKKFSADTLSEDWIYNMAMYRSKITGMNYPYLNYYYPYLRSPSAMQEASSQSKYNSLTRQIASSLPKSLVLDESLLLDFYSTDTPSFELIKKYPREDSHLRVLHEALYDKTYRIPQLHLAFTAGLISPNGNLALFGPRPSLGFLMGGKKVNHSYDLYLDFRIGPSKNEYTVMYNGFPRDISSWSGLYLGFEYGYDILHVNNFHVALSPGIALDRITALSLDNDFGEDALFLHTLNINSGLNLRYHYNSKSYVGLQTKYHWVDFENKGGTDLSGNYFSVRLIFGSYMEESRSRMLELLK